MQKTFSTAVRVVNGVRIQVLTAGAGRSIVFLHGAGTGTGFDYLLPLARDRQLVIPVHPGFGASDDAPTFDTLLDYVMHYAAFIDGLAGGDEIDLIGHSLGGWMAAMIAAASIGRIRRLVLASPAGLRAREHPGVDLFTIRPEAFAGYISANPETLERMRGGMQSNEAKVARYRELTTLARITWNRSYDPKLDRWLGQIKAPTLVLWGEQDRVLPVQQSADWLNSIAGSEAATFPAAGHLLLADAPEAVLRAGSFLREGAYAAAGTPA